ncbi:MAG: hypothetical protein JWO58_3222 [Chitinophagaceae bacterium]|nr:hypothetical protein [Chitinophagaceae bacterium]
MRLLAFLRIHFFILTSLLLLSGWGFFAHKRINYQAVFSLPPELFVFYKSYSLYISEHAVDPDKRRYILKEEACKHFIDLDHYPTIREQQVAVSYYAAAELYSEDTLKRHGTVPWTILLYMKKLEQAFLEQNSEHILKYSADLGHYIGDAHVPLHTTSNYNGQLTNQHGIHGLWESRLPEIYYDHYQLWIGQAQYLVSPSDSIWKCIFESHALVEKVLLAERDVSKQFNERKKYSIEHRNGLPIKNYSILFCKRYNERMGNMVEERLRKAIRFTADCWYTCWVNAGKPALPETKSKWFVKKSKEESGSADESCIH